MANSRSRIGALARPKPIAAKSRARAYRFFRVYVRLDLGPQGRDGYSWQFHWKPRGDPSDAGQHRTIHRRELGAALSRYWPEPECSAVALRRRALRVIGAGHVHPASDAVVARTP